MLDQVDGYLKSLSKYAVLAMSVLVISILGYVDHIIAPRLSLSVFYAIPVAGSSWYINRRSGVFMSVVAAATWLAADLAAGHTYVHFLVPFWNSLVRLAFFVIISLLLSLIKAKLEMEESFADTDYLTGLNNSRSFYEHVELESVRSGRYRHPFTIAYIDVDNFKHVNDTMGHDSGDEVLRTVAQTIKDHVRLSDITGRLGGDEFAILFTETAYEAAESIIQNIVPVLSDGMKRTKHPVTFSIGAVSFNRPMDTVREMIKKVDDVMFEVKKSGKNNVIHREWPKGG